MTNKYRIYYYAPHAGDEYLMDCLEADNIGILLDIHVANPQPEYTHEVRVSNDDFETSQLIGTETRERAANCNFS